MYYYLSLYILYIHYSFRDIHAIDISETVIFKMQEKYADYAGVSFSVMDVRLLNAIPDKTYTLVLDQDLIQHLKKYIVY